MTETRDTAQAEEEHTESHCLIQHREIASRAHVNESGKAWGMVRGCQKLADQGGKSPNSMAVSRLKAAPEPCAAQCGSCGLGRAHAVKDAPRETRRPAFLTAALRTDRHPVHGRTPPGGAGVCLKGRALWGPTQSSYKAVGAHCKIGWGGAVTGDWKSGGGGWHKASVSDCLPLAAPIGLSPLLILTLCGPERVLVVSTEPPDDLSCLTTPGVGCPGDGLLPVPGGGGGIGAVGVPSGRVLGGAWGEGGGCPHPFKQSPSEGGPPSATPFPPARPTSASPCPGR